MNSRLFSVMEGKAESANDINVRSRTSCHCVFQFVMNVRSSTLLKCHWQVRLHVHVAFFHCCCCCLQCKRRENNHIFAYCFHIFVGNDHTMTNYINRMKAIFFVRIFKKNAHIHTIHFVFFCVLFFFIVVVFFAVRSMKSGHTNSTLNYSLYII